MFSFCLFLSIILSGRFCSKVKIAAWRLFVTPPKVIFFSRNKGQLRTAVTRPCRLSTPLCHTYSEPSGHEDSPGGTQNIPYLFKNLSKSRLSDSFFGLFLVISEVGSQIYIANLVITKIWVFSATFLHEITLSAIDIEKNTLKPLWKSALNHTQLSGTSAIESYEADRINRNHFHQSSLNVLLQPLSSPSSQHIGRLIQRQQIEQTPPPRIIIIMVIITTINFNIITIIAIITIITTTVSSSPIKTLKKPPPCCAKVWEEGSCHEEDSCAENGVIWQLHHLHHHHHHQWNEFNQAYWEQNSQFHILPNSVI